MSYQYQKKSADTLEEIAGFMLGKTQHRRNGLAVDIEGILEDLGITILPRRGGLHKYAYGYTPKDPHFVVVAEAPASHPPTYRAIIAEELAHIILEYDLWTGGQLPEGADGHELTPQQNQDIEADADYLACALLFPKKQFKARFVCHEHQLQKDGETPDRVVRGCIERLGKEFEVWPSSTARRAMHLQLISPEELKRNYSDRILF